MGYFPVRSDSRVIIYERKMCIRMANGLIPLLFGFCKQAAEPILACSGREEAHVPKVVGSNPSAVYWMDMTFFHIDLL